jgi:hypothetical protein
MMGVRAHWQFIDLRRASTFWCDARHMMQAHSEVQSREKEILWYKSAL